MSKVIPKRYNTLNCIENCIANICDTYGIDYRPLFLFSWDFGYDQSKATVGERIHYRNNYELDLDDYVKIASDYLKINCEEHTLEYDLCGSQIRNNQIYMVNIDSFDCKWNLAYQKYHYSHYFLIEKTVMEDYVNIEGIDSFSSLNIQHITVDCLNAIRKLYCISILENNIDMQSYQKQLKQRYLEFISSNIQKGIYNNINIFAHELLEADDINNLSPQMIDITNAYIIRRLSYIANSRYNTILLFKYLCLDKMLVSDMESIYGKWESIKNLFIKMLISKNMKRISQASELIMSIAYDEESLATRLLKG